MGEQAMAEAVPVKLENTAQGWQLLRDGEPYFIRGAGGSGASLEQLADAGANSVRTWGADNVGDILDQAHALGLTVTVGIWLGQERHGFDYNDPGQVREQLERAREPVLRYKDHPAVLLWGIGNEVEGFDAGDNPAIWKAVNDVAAMVKELDPHHPTMTVTAFVHGGRIENLHKHSPAIDIHGVNAYGGAHVVPEQLRAGGATKPFVLTEFGPLGPWETQKTRWGAPFEQTSTEKAAYYRSNYQRAVLDSPGLALGSYAFLWGHKMEATSTWFGMFLDDGSRLAAVDAMTEMWSGEFPDDRAPTIEPLIVDGGLEVDPGAEIRVRAEADDPEGGPLSVRWVLRQDSGDYLTGGDYRPQPLDVDGAILEGDAGGARVRMPEYPGAYRLFQYVYDESGNAATANVPLLVTGEAGTPMPFPVFENGFEGMPWVPSGWMGAIDSLTLDGNYADNPHAGEACIKLRYTGKYDWVGVAWQHPPNNRGETDGGYDLTGANYLELWARGEYGGEKVKFGVGLLGSEKTYPDSGQANINGIVLTAEWQQYRIPLEDIDLSSIKTGFYIVITGGSSSVTVYLDSIRFAR